MKVNVRVIATSIFILLAGCQSNQQIENTFNSEYLSNSSDLVFTSPNFSALHAPPLISGFSYVETYEQKDFCTEKTPTVIGKVTVTRKNKTQFSKLPSGKIVALVGYHAVGAGGLRGKAYYAFNVEPDAKYKITVTESRPLVTSYSVAIEKTTEAESIPVQVIEGRKKICEHS